MSQQKECTVVSLPRIDVYDLIGYVVIVVAQSLSLSFLISVALDHGKRDTKSAQRQ